MTENESMEQLRRMVQSLEKRLVNETNVRFAMIRYSRSYLMSADLEGDYCEFGVGEGRIFSYATHMLSSKFPAMNFWGFDTFSGIPDNIGSQDMKEFDPGYSPGQFKGSKDDIMKALRKENPKVDDGRIHLVQGEFSKTLRRDCKRPEAVAFAFIDAIFYESIIDVLAFLTPRLRPGSLLVFDDWRAMRNRPDLGSQRACAEWKEKDGIGLAPCFSYGGIGQSFTVVDCSCGEE